jgi:uncharacterized repeat protein (TIGR01451 family)
MTHRNARPISWRNCAVVLVSFWLATSTAGLGTAGIGAASADTQSADRARWEHVRLSLERSGLDSMRATGLARLYVQLATGGAFSSEEASVLRSFAAGRPISELEADTVIARVIYARHVAGTPLQPQEQALLARYEQAAYQKQHFGDMQAAVQRPLSAIRDEIEPNNVTARANAPANRFFSGVLATPLPSADTDLFTINVPGDSFVVLSLDGDPFRQQARLGARLELLDAHGAALTPAYRVGGANTPAQLAIFAASAPGTYYAKISGDPKAAAPAGAGAYRLAADLLAKTRKPSTPPVAEASAVNGGFETGDFTGWTPSVVCVQNLADWFVYSGTTLPISGNTFDAPPEGTFAAVSDMNFVSTLVLYQDFVLEAGQTHTLSFLHAFQNLHGINYSPPTLDCTAVPNQQYRVDILNPAAPIDSVDPLDVLANVFQTTPGGPTTQPYTPVTFDLTPFAGQTVRLRFAVVDTEFFFHVGVDAVSVLSLMPGTGLGVTKTDSPDPVATGTQLTYTITVTNNEVAAAPTVTLTDAVPADTTFRSIAAPAGWTCTTPAVGGTGPITCTAPSLAGSTVATFTLVVDVSCAAVDGATITNTATVSSAAPDIDPTNNTATATTTAFNPPPVITCPADITATANTLVGCDLTGATVTYEVTATDNCPGTTVVCTPPSGTFFANGTTTPVTCTATDASGLTATCGFSVIVAEPTETVCLVDDFSGDTFTEVVDQDSAFGFWRYTVAATGQIYCGVADYVGFSPGRSLVSRDTVTPGMTVSANLACGGGTAQVFGPAGTTFTLRDRNTCDSVCGAPLPD